MSVLLSRASTLLVFTTACAASTTPAVSSRARSPRPRPSPPREPVTAAPALTTVPIPCADPGDRDFGDVLPLPTSLDSTSTTVGCLTSADRDLFQITVPRGDAGWLVTYDQRGHGGLRPWVQLLDGSGRDLGRVDSGADAVGRGWVHVAGATSIYLRVGHDDGSSGAYTLHVATTALPDPDEPDSSASTATPLALGAPASGYLSRAVNSEDDGDDWFVVRIGAPGKLAIDVDLSQGVMATVTLLDGRHQRIASRASEPGEHVRLPAKVRAAGFYYVQLRGSQPLPSSGRGEVPPALIRPYTLTVTR
jgi:hypothetical protein